MIKIIKSSEPKCLTDLKSTNDKVYDDLQGACKETVTTLLNGDQKGLCAYCQRKLKFGTYIEHYIPQTIDPDKQLDFDNFLGVCSGKYYLNKKTGDAISFCSSKRGAEELTIDPLKEIDIATIYYDKDYKIKSTNSTFQNEFNETLYLNFDEICLERAYYFDEELEIVQELALEMDLSPIEAYKKAIASVSARTPEYSGFLIFKFRELIKFHST